MALPAAVGNPARPSGASHQMSVLAPLTSADCSAPLARERRGKTPFSQDPSIWSSETELRPRLRENRTPPSTGRERNRPTDPRRRLGDAIPDNPTRRLAGWPAPPMARPAGRATPRSGPSGRWELRRRDCPGRSTRVVKPLPNGAANTTRTSRQTLPNLDGRAGTNFQWLLLEDHRLQRRPGRDSPRHRPSGLRIRGWHPEDSAEVRASPAPESGGETAFPWGSSNTGTPKRKNAPHACLAKGSSLRHGQV